MTINALFLDVANTLLNKPDLFKVIQDVLSESGHVVTLADISFRHRLLSEVVIFPDRTSSEFYQEFNSNLLRLCGIIPSVKLLDELFGACSYLPWGSFEDNSHLESICIPIGILSNWDSTLRERISFIPGLEPEWVFGSEECKVRKPNPNFFKLAIEATGLPAAQIAYVGDSIRLDIEPALELGIRAILIDRENIYKNSSLERIRHFGELKDFL